MASLKVTLQPVPEYVPPAPVCSIAEEAAARAAKALVTKDCELFMESFKTCSDSCVSGFQNWQNAAPANCTTGTTGITEQAAAAAELSSCEILRADTTDKYVPQPEPALPECTSIDEMEISKHDRRRTEYFNCISTMSSSSLCFDSCLKTLEDGLDDLPNCRYSGDYSSREVHKIYLVKCLKLRNESLATNAALQSKGSPDRAARIKRPTPSSGAASWRVSVRAAAACIALVALSFA